MRFLLTCFMGLTWLSAATANDDDFPPYSRPTLLDYPTFLGGDRVDFALEAADKLQAAGFNGDAQRIRAAFRTPWQPMHRVYRLRAGKHVITSNPTESPAKQ